MIVSISWLKEYVDISLPSLDLADKLTNIGLESDVILNGKALDIEITPNRPDCMSHVGVAREIALITNQKLRYPKIKLKESSHPVANEIMVKIENPKGCPRYACRVIKNVNVGPSPSWLVEQLEMVGLRSINNIVDISNYVLMEFGHPLHTFDLTKIGGKTIVVRNASKGETLITLDGENRKLNLEHLLICDAEIPVALAGIMGGENSEVFEETRDVLIESAYFEPVTIRKGSKALGLSTEASKRFERGTDYEGLIVALDRTANMIAEIAGGEIIKGIVDEYPNRKQPPKIHFQMTKASAITGVEFTDEFVSNTFKGLEISFSKKPDGYECLVPSFRPDLERPIDLVEELARIYGYGNIKSDFSYDGWLGTDFKDQMTEIVKLKRFFAGLGFNETLTNSLLNPKEVKNVFPEKAVAVQNPLSIEMSILRVSLFPGLLSSVAYNLRRGESNLTLFEYGDTFVQNKKVKVGCEEREEFCGILCGDKSLKQWKGEPQPRDFFTMKGYMESLAKFLRIPQYRFEDLPEHTVFSIGQVLLSSENKQIGEFGLFHFSLLSSYGIEIPVLGFLLNLNTIREALSRTALHSGVSQFPGISRDLSFIIKKSISVGELESTIKEYGDKLLRRVSLYDFYEGDQISKGFKSVTFNLFFQESSRTLTDDDVDKIITSIISKVSQHLDGKLR